MAERVSTAQAQGEGSPEPYVPNPYPWGLRLSLSNEQLAQFGIEKPMAGESYDVDALGVVVSVSADDQDADGDVDNVRVEIQITELALSKVADSSGNDSDAADTMYGKKE